MFFGEVFFIPPPVSEKTSNRDYIRGLRARTEDFSSVAEGGVQTLSLPLTDDYTLHTIVTNFNFVTLTVESRVLHVFLTVVIDQRPWFVTWTAIYIISELKIILVESINRSVFDTNKKQLSTRIRRR